MLTYLFIASRKGFKVSSYEDEAVGVMTRNEKGVLWVSAVTLHPRITYGSKTPTAEEESQMHHAAHEDCFIANSVKTEVRVAS